MADEKHEDKKAQDGKADRGDRRTQNRAEPWHCA
jgi:hypothetical protein